MGTARVHTVIDMQSLEFFQTDHSIKFIQHSVKVINYIIPGITDVTCIKAYSHFFFVICTQNDFGKLFKPAADLTALSGHGLKQDGSGLLLSDYLVEQVTYELYALFNSLSHMVQRSPFSNVVDAVYTSKYFPGSIGVILHLYVL